MNRLWVLMLTLLLAFGAVPSALAATPSASESAAGAPTQDNALLNDGAGQQDVGDEEGLKDDDDAQQDDEGEEGEANDEEAENEEDASKQHARKPLPPQARKGLEQALENVKGTPAEKVIQELLNGALTPEEAAKQLKEAEKLLKKQKKQLSKKEQAALKEMLKAARKVLEQMEEGDEELEEDDLLERAQALQSLAQLFAENNDWLAAIEAQEKLVRVKKADEQAFAYLGRLYQKAGKKGIKTFVNGEPVSFDVPPVIENGRTLVPIRAVAESLKANVQWIETTKTVVIERDGVVVQLTINQRVARVNGRQVTLDVPATIRGGRTIVPMRFISEALGANVKWIQEGQIIVVTDEAAGQPVEQPAQQPTPPANEQPASPSAPAPTAEPATQPAQ